jgi:hypothetical protein
MNDQAAICVLAIWIGASALAVQARNIQQPAVPKQLRIETIPPGTVMGPAPKSWNDFVERSDAIVKISFLAYSTVQFPLVLSNRTVPVVFTRYEGTVSEVFKDSTSHRVLSSVSVYRRGGIFDTPQGRVKQVEKDFPDWIMGQDYILCLKWTGTPINSYGILYGADGTFHLRENGIVEAPGGAPFSHEQRGKSVRSLVAELRTAVAGKPRR